MSRGVNKCIFIGTLGADPECRYTASGSAIASFRIAVNESWKDKQGEKQERTEWISITAFGRLGEISAEYLRKGAQVYIEGKLETQKWQDKDGNDRYTTKVIANDLQMLGGKPEHRDDGAARNGGPKQQGFRGNGGRSDPPPDDGFHQDDIPFS